VSTYFISDLHLCESEPHLTALFHHFITDVASDAQTLYILGDFFQAWVGDDIKTDFVERIINTLKARHEQGTLIYFMHGNRDFLLGKHFANACGGSLINDPSVITLHGERYLLSHGDVFCTDDKAYQRYRSIARMRWLQTLFLMLPKKLRLNIASRMRQYSREQFAKQRDTKDLSDAKWEAIVETLDQQTCDRIIHGHTHKPTIHISPNNPTYRRWVLSDWGEQGHYLKIADNGQITMQYFSL